MVETILDENYLFTVNMPEPTFEPHPASDMIIDEILSFQGRCGPNWIHSINSIGYDVNGSEIGFGNRFFVEIEALQGSPYANTNHVLEMRMPLDYPDSPIFIRFVDLIHHELILNYGDVKDFFYSKILNWNNRREKGGILYTLDAIRSVLVARLPEGMELSDNEIKRYWLDYNPEKLSLREDELENALKKFRNIYQRKVQKLHEHHVQITKDIAYAISSHKRLHKNLFIKSIEDYSDFWIAPELKNFLSDPSSMDRADNLFEKICDGVWCFQIFTPNYAQKLISEFLKFKNTLLPRQCPNSLQHGNTGIIPSRMGLDIHMKAIFEKIIKPVSAYLYFDTEFGNSLDHFHAFSITKNKNMGTPGHIDDSEISLNICLGKNFQDGNLSLCDDITGKKCQNVMNYIYKQTPLYAIIHEGRRRHKAFAVTSGERINLIFWARSSHFRREGKLFELRRSVHEDKIHENCA